MLHPDAELRHAGDDKGYGLFAKHPIPAGTLTYVKDALELIIEPDDRRLQSRLQRMLIERYTYREASGSRVLSWDLAKYMNHACSPNTMSTGWGFEIALRDIASGDEITDEYGLFNIERDMPCACGSPHCRRLIRPHDLDRYGNHWDRQLQEPLRQILEVGQPLMPYLDRRVQRQLKRYLRTGSGYRSVHKLAYRPAVAAHCSTG